MKPFDLPANGNAPAGGVALWYGMPYALWALSLQMAIQNWRFVAAAQQAAIDAFMSAGVTENAPVTACMAADVRETSAAVLKAQLDAIDTFRRAI